jgi:hypothetical protein
MAGDSDRGRKVIETWSMQKLARRYRPAPNLSTCLPIELPLVLHSTMSKYESTGRKWVRASYNHTIESLHSHTNILKLTQNNM